MNCLECLNVNCSHLKDGRLSQSVDSRVIQWIGTLWLRIQCEEKEMRLNCIPYDS